jgi:hypothetical protein
MAHARRGLSRFCSILIASNGAAAHSGVMTTKSQPELGYSVTFELSIAPRSRGKPLFKLEKIKRVWPATVEEETRWNRIPDSPLFHTSAICPPT